MGNSRLCIKIIEIEQGKAKDNKLQRAQYQTGPEPGKFTMTPGKLLNLHSHEHQCHFPCNRETSFCNTPETRSWISRKIESTSNQICRQVWQSQLWLREPPWGEDFAHWFQSRSRDWQLSLKRIWRVSWPATVMYDAAIVPRYFFPNAANLPRLVCWRNHKNYIGAFKHESGFSLWGSLEEYTLVWQSPTCRMIFDFF